MKTSIKNVAVQSAIAESHCTHSLEGDPGEAKHRRVMYVINQFPTLDYSEVSYEMAKRDKQEDDSCKAILKKYAERRAHMDF